MNSNEFLIELDKIGIKLNSQKLSLLEEYYSILYKENQKYNLTRIISKDDVYLKHFYDSLTLIKVTSLDNKKICDIGSGAGFPGLVIAICFPNSLITLIESNRKKCKFLNKVIEKLNLQNVTVINARTEEYARDNREIFDIVTARAVAPLKHLLEYGVPLVKVNGIFVAMKANLGDEIININNYYNKLNIKKENKISFQLYNNDNLRTLICFRKLAKTNIKYPRNYKDILKKDI